MFALFGIALLSIPVFLLVGIVFSVIVGTVLSAIERLRFLAPVFLNIIPCTLFGSGALGGLLLYLAVQYECDEGVLIGAIVGAVIGGILGHAAGWALACLRWRRWSRQAAAVQ